MSEVKPLDSISSVACHLPLASENRENYLSSTTSSKKTKENDVSKEPSSRKATSKLSMSSSFYKTKNKSSGPYKPDSSDSKNNSNSSDSKPGKQSNVQQPSKVPCASNANELDSIQQLETIESIQQLKSISTSKNGTVDSVNVSIDLVLRLLNDTGLISSASERNPLQDISNVPRDDEAKQADLSNEITQEVIQSSDDDTDSGPSDDTLDNAEAEVFEYEPKVSIEPYSEALLLNNFVSNIPYPEKSVNYRGNDKKTKKKMILVVLKWLEESLRTSGVHRNTSRSYEERKKEAKDKVKVTFASGDVAYLHKALALSLFGPDGKPRGASELYLQTPEDVDFLNLKYEKTGYVLPPLCGEIGKGLEQLVILFVNLSSFNCEEGTTTYSTQKRFLDKLCNLFPGSKGRVGFCNQEAFISMHDRRYLTILDRFLTAAKSEIYENDQQVKEALNKLLEAISIEREATAYILRNVQRRAFLQAKEVYSDLKIYSAADFSAKNIDLIVG